MTFKTFAGNTNINIIDYANLTNPEILNHVSYPGVHVIDIAVCGDYVFTTNTNEADPENGYVNVYTAYDKQTNTLTLLDSVVGKALYVCCFCLNLFMSFTWNVFKFSLNNLILYSNTFVCCDFYFPVNSNLEWKVDYFSCKNLLSIYKRFFVLQTSQVGPTPDMIKPTSSCKKAIVAVEGEPHDDEGSQTLVDSPGGIGIVTITDSDTLEFTLIDFQNFDNQ